MEMVERDKRKLPYLYYHLLGIEEKGIFLLLLYIIHPLIPSIYLEQS